MRNEFYFQLDITKEQLDCANKLVEYSILHHPVSDIFKNDPGGKERQREFRQTGTIGEIMFADVYDLPRPTKSFGAVDGQDYGQDFILKIEGHDHAFDTKTMSRKNNIFKTNYVLNLPAYQMIRNETITEFYFCISIHRNFQNNYIASFIGYVSKQEIQNGEIGILYKAGTKRINGGGGFVFQRDTYEIDFKDITSPVLPEKVKKMLGFQIKKILP